MIASGNEREREREREGERGRREGCSRRGGEFAPAPPVLIAGMVSILRPRRGKRETDLISRAYPSPIRARDADIAITACPPTFYDATTAHLRRLPKAALEAPRFEHPIGRVKDSIIRLRRSLTRRCKVPRVAELTRSQCTAEESLVDFRQGRESFLSRKSQALSLYDRDENALGIVYT